MVTMRTEGSLKVTIVLRKGRVDHFGKMGTEQLRVVQLAGLCRLWLTPAVLMQAAHRKLLTCLDCISALLLSPFLPLFSHLRMREPQNCRKYAVP